MKRGEEEEEEEEREENGGRAEEAKFHMKEASETNEGTNQGSSRAGNDGGRRTADGRMSERRKEGKGREGKKEREINDASAMGPKERGIANE